MKCFVLATQALIMHLFSCKTQVHEHFYLLRFRLSMTVSVANSAPFLQSESLLRNMSYPSDIFCSPPFPCIIPQCHQHEYEIFRHLQHLTSLSKTSASTILMKIKLYFRLLVFISSVCGSCSFSWIFSWISSQSQRMLDQQDPLYIQPDAVEVLVATLAVLSEVCGCHISMQCCCTPTVGFPTMHHRLA